MSDLRTCSKCGEAKPPSEFYRHSGDRLRSECKPCTRAKARRQYDKTREQVLAQKRDYYAENRDEIRAKQAAWLNRPGVRERLYTARKPYITAYNARPEVKEADRRRNLWKRFRITPEDYDAIHDAQGGRCALCGQPETKRGASLAVDHDHTTGRIRGLLCNACNRGLGALGDDLASLTRAVEYLREHEANPDRFPGRVPENAGRASRRG